MVNTDEEDDYVFCGTPIEREEDITSRRKKSIAESAGQLRTLPSWKQEVRDEDGRRRFHGAFTGGFSAGYYNTVGSKEGWTPQSFTSSRKHRAEFKQQNILNFLDDDERAEMEGHSLGASSQFDTFGFTAAEVARKQVEKEKQQRPSIIPGPVPDELVLPVTESIGVKLLLKMGWRRGHSIKDSRTESLYDARREARKAFLALSSNGSKTRHSDSEQVKGDIENEIDLPVYDDAQSSQSIPVYVLNPKQDLYGLGFDPFKHAPEFREKKRSRMSGSKERLSKAFPLKDNLFAFKSGNIAPGFGIGALEEHDAEDEDVYASGYDFEDRYVQDIEESSSLSTDHKPKLTYKEKGVLLGFKTASNADSLLERFDPPVIPKDFVPRHEFPFPHVAEDKVEDSGPPEVPPPEDNNLKVLIEGVATLVARCGKLFEDLSREKNQSNPLFCFLEGGNGHDYYARKLWERQKRINQTKLQVDEKSSQRAQKLTAEDRGKILGERPLERSSKDSSSSAASADLVQLQFNLSETFTKPASHNELPEVAKPFKGDPAKQERFELFLKEKYQGGLRSFLSGRASNMSEDARARERLDFEAAAEVIERGKLGKDLSTHKFNGILTTSKTQFTSGREELAEAIQAEDVTMKKLYPKREQFQWRPSPILCKRFDITDPFMGKPPPPPRLKSKMDSLVFTLESVRATETEVCVGATGEPSPVSLCDVQKINADVSSEKEVEVLELENVERPVDLYKAIFSDDSDDEVTKPGSNLVENPQKKAVGASTTLNRLIAGDFLESLGKELGLEVPPEAAYSKKIAETVIQDSFNGIGGNINTLPIENKDSLTPSSIRATSSERKGWLSHGQLLSPDIAQQCVVQIEHDSHEYKSGKLKADPMNQKTEKVETPLGRHKSRTSSFSSEDERSRKRSKRRRHRSISSCDSDSSSSDYRDRYPSKSRGRRKESSRERSHPSHKHSKHRRHK